MAAKIKSRNPYGHEPHRFKPRGVSGREFEKVYWPFIPVILAIALLLPLSLRAGAFTRTPGQVLSYATSENPAALLIDTNSQRSSVGEPILQLNSSLNQAATAKAKDMAARNYWSHDTPEGNPPWTFVSATGYSYTKLGENLAAGFSDEQSVIKAWMASAPHRENLLDPAYTQVGFGYANAASFTASGGAPVTIVVAFYGDPSDSSATPTEVGANSSNMPTTSSTDARALGVSTRRADLAIGHQLNNWGVAIIALGLAAVAGALVGRHLRAIRRFARQGEQFVWHHPLFDLGLVIVGLLLFLLGQTAGLIQ